VNDQPASIQQEENKEQPELAPSGFRRPGRIPQRQQTAFLPSAARERVCGIGNIARSVAQAPKLFELDLEVIHKERRRDRCEDHHLRDCFH
jgi:hypothetical protein